MIQKTALAAVVSLLLIFSGCSENEQNIRVYSDRAEVAVLVNLFNQSQQQYRADFIYPSQGREEAVNPGEQDIVISSGLHSSLYKEKLRNLDSLRKSPFVRNIYPEILKTGVGGTALKAIPLSLSIPLVISANEISEGKYTSWEELSRFAADYNLIKEDRLTRGGFSPSWSETFISAYFNSRIASYSREMSANEFRNFTGIAGELRNWIEENNGSLEMCRAFSDKYRYIPDYRLIMNGRIAMSIIELEEWALLPDSISRELYAEILQFEDGIQTNGILSVGIPLQSENQEGALQFLTWLLDEKTWEDYLTIVIRNRDESFAFLNGISSSEKLNTRLLTQFYPWMEQHSPRAGEFASQTEIEPQWAQVWPGLLLPLVMESISNPQYAKDIGNEYRKWLLLNPDPWQEE